MKPNEHHLSVINTLKSVLNCWEDTNDIKSLSHLNLIWEYLNLDLSEKFEESYINDLEDIITKLYCLVQRAEKECLTNNE